MSAQSCTICRCCCGSNLPTQPTYRRLHHLSSATVAAPSYFSIRFVGSNFLYLSPSLGSISEGLPTKSSDDPTVLTLRKFSWKFLPTVPHWVDFRLGYLMHRRSFWLSPSTYWVGFSLSHPMISILRKISEIFLSSSLISHFSSAGRRATYLYPWFSRPMEAQLLQHTLCHYIFTAHSGPCYNLCSDTTL